MNRIHLIPASLLLAFLVGCGGSNPSTEDFITVDVTKSYPKKELILQDFMDVEYIPLETNENFLTTGSVQAISDDVIIVKDLNRVKTGDIFVFDRKGRCLKRFNRLGQGGEEYTNILGIVYDENSDEIFINNHFSQKVLVYDLLGNFKRSFKQREGFFYDQIGNFDSDNIICHDGYLEFNKPNLKRNFFLISSKENGTVKEIEFPYKEKNQE